MNVASIRPRTQQAPVVVVRTRWVGPAALAIAGAAMMLVMVFADFGLLGWLRAAAALTFLFIAWMALRRVFDRRPWVTIDDRGFSVRGYDVHIRWHEIILIQSFRIPRIHCGAFAVFVNDEAARRLGPAKDKETIFLFADVGSPLQQRHIWLGDAGLDSSAKDIAAELEARRNGSTGPLTARAMKKERK